MNEYTASNGVTVEWDAERGMFTLDSPSGPSQIYWFNAEDRRALSDYFQAERDAELDRWRDTEHPERAVYRRVDNSLLILDETDGDHWTVRIDEIKDYDECHPVASTIRAWLAAHPEPKPWHDAKQNDLWELMINGCHSPEVYRFASELRSTSKFRPVNSPSRVAFEAADPRIIRAHRIYPPADPS